METVDSVKADPDEPMVSESVEIEGLQPDQIEPERPDAFFSLARTYHKGGQHGTAVAHLEMILEKRPDDVEALVRAAVAQAGPSRSAAR